MILDFAVTTVVNGSGLLGEIGGVAAGDRRLSDARTPLAHNHPTSEVVGLVATLAALATTTPRFDMILLKNVTDGLYYEVVVDSSSGTPTPVCTATPGIA